VKERNELRSQNRSLKRQVSRLKKQLKQAEVGNDLPEHEESLAEATSNSKGACPKCGSDDVGTYTLTVGSKKTVMGCRACKRWHRTVS